MNAMSVEKEDAAPLSCAANNPLEQFVLLAKGTKAVACAELIKQALEAPGVHVFGELLEMPNVKELENGPHAVHFNTLNLFAYGTYKEYQKNKSDYLELTPAQQKKLKHLTIVTLATQEKCIPYATLLEELDIKNVRDLEDLIIEAIYADIIHGKLDQKRSRLEVDYALGRDARPEDAAAIAAVLEEWCSACDSVLACVDTQIRRANNEKMRHIKNKESIEQEITNIRRALKTQAEMEEGGSGSAGTSDGHERSKKATSKGKPLRNTAKFWQKTT